MLLEKKKVNTITRFEITLNNFYFETLNDLVNQYNELISGHDTNKYSMQDVLELLILKEYVNSEIKSIRP